jgi:hypothetical protein
VMWPMNPIWWSKPLKTSQKKVWCPFLHIIDSWVVNDTMFWSWMVKPNQD